MYITRLIKIVASLFIVILFSAHNSNAYTNLNKVLFLNSSDQQLFLEFQEILSDITTEQETSAASIEIFDENLNIIAFGIENEEKINTLINKSDFIAEIKGKKYFRLDYDNE